MQSVTVTRNRGWYGRLRAARIMADRTEIGLVACGESVEVLVPDQATNLYVKMGWGRSRPYPIKSIPSGRVLYMNAWLTLSLLENLGMLPIPIALEDTPR